ncbi:Hvo_1808 family surface protein [Halorubrum sp. AD140]|uniref:Hvo_1808 family surface protein n=1 Tax=Halorubrum sp. AD140 TaxID=3050073 RepID=UPI002ACCBD69|nr:Hvo_1808 family surface protein [Halorubrum sp. AD140]MDZ5810435.1 Hvo_1808 family surface protein [Halorubrum sp. AD140]
MRRVLTLSVVAAIALLALSAGGVAAGPTGPADVADGGNAHSATAEECETGNDTELVGCWNGTHYEEELSFNQSDGLNESELEALTHLTMARVEHLRERPFREDVPVETVTRSEFSNESTGVTDENDSSGEEFRRWNDQVWEALFVVGEDEDANDEIDSVFGGAVSGFYSPSEDRIVLVVADGEEDEVQVDSSTLAHELVHAMQDQYYDLTRPRYVGTTQDGDLAVDGIVEGEAVHVEELYAARCADDDWRCLDGPDDGGGGGSGADYNFGILQTVLQPYSDGALYVEELVDEEGWDAVDEAMTEPPESTAEVIHRNPDYETREVEFEDAATGDWETYPDQGADGAETAGEASMFVMFWYQSLEYGHPVLEPGESAQENVRIHTQPDEELRTRANYNYAHESTDGWAGDELYPYRDGDGEDARDGYVWVTEWQTDADAADFRETYLEMLTAHGDAAHDEGEVYEIDDGDFPGAYGVERDGTTVTITHAPEPAGVLELRPDADLELPSTDDRNDGDDGSDGDGSDGDDGDEGSDGDDGDDGADGDDVSSEPDGSTDDGVPGFGVVAALLGVLAAVSLLAPRD